MRYYTDIEGGLWKPFTIHISNKVLVKLLETARRKQKKGWKPERDALGEIIDENETFIATPVKIKIRETEMTIASMLFSDKTYWNFVSGNTGKAKNFKLRGMKP